jgi:hypothetical protein
MDIDHCNTNANTCKRKGKFVPLHFMKAYRESRRIHPRIDPRIDPRIHPRIDPRIDPVAQLIEALRYKLEGRGFDSRWGHWDFLST